MSRRALVAILLSALAASVATGDVAMAGEKTKASIKKAGKKASAAKPIGKKQSAKKASVEKPSAKKTKKKVASERAERDKKRKRSKDRPLAEPPRYREPSLSILPVPIRCPAEMVAVAGRFCVDRFEATLVDAVTGAPLSPYYPPARELAEPIFTAWTAAREQAPPGSLEQLMPIPPLDAEPRVVRPLATSLAVSLPNGYVPGHLAAEACTAAGKRLCRSAEWVTACRGEAQTTFPYGARYVQDACNVFREEHPAHLLHGSASHGHSDPRLNQVAYEGRPLLRLTGASSCVSRWGDDGVHDMVGNVDEWIDDPEGTFVGGFYSRATRNGCDARVAGHPIRYFDYSTGVRCCKDPDP